MSTKQSALTPGSRSVIRMVASGMMLGATLLTTTQTQAAFHLWNIREVYTDASGTRQFIEFFTSSSSQQFVGGQQITVTPAGGGPPHTFTIPSNLPGDTFNHAFLIATLQADADGGPTPDFVLPTNFLFPAGGTISFFGANSGPYTALPTDGVQSRAFQTGANNPNSPQNFAGLVGFVVGANSPPAVLITDPPNNTLFASAGAVSVGVSAADSDGSVTNVQLLTNGVAAATRTNAPFDFTLSNLTAGYYSLRAWAVDNQAAVATSAPVTIRVAPRPSLSFERGTNGPLRFQFNSVTGVNYVVEGSTALTNFSSIVTNAGSGSPLQFSQTNPAPTQRFFRLRLE